MYVITDVTILTVPERDTVTLPSRLSNVVATGYNNKEVSYEPITVEQLQGERVVFYRNGVRQEFCLAVSGEAKDVLGIYLDILLDNNAEKETLIQDNKQLVKHRDRWSSKYLRVVSMPFWERLKFLFFGKEIKGYE